MTWPPTTEQILNLDGVHQRLDRFRFELCSPTHEPIGELHPDRSGTVPTIENDTGNTVSRRLRGLRLLPDEADDVNVLRDRLRVYMVLQNGAEFLLGTFMWGDDSIARRSWGDEHHQELVDYSYVLNQQTLQALGWETGANLAMVLMFLALRVGFRMEDIAPFRTALMVTNLAEPRAWQPNATWYQIMSDLTVMVGYAPPWFDRSGRLHLDEPPNPLLDPPTIPAYEAGTRVIANSIVPSNSLLSAANDFAVFDSGGLGLLGRYQIPASAPHSIVNRAGFRVGLAESVQGMADQAQADRSARNLALTKGVAFEWLTFSSTLDPRHDTWDVVTAFGRNWLETSQDMELRSGGTHKHVMKRPFYEPT
jgi:hypothetical protein